MKQIQRRAALALALALLLALVPANALAANKVKTLKTNTWYATQEPDPDNMTVYKLKLTAESVVYVSWKNAHAKSTFAEVDFCEDRDCSYVDAMVEFYAPSSGKRGVVLYPGAYYVAAMDVIRGSKVKFTTLKASYLNPKNTTSAKATAINSGKTTEVVFDRRNAKPRWYKLRLTRKQAVTLCGDCAGITLYTSAMKKVPMRKGWDSKNAADKWVSKSKLGKGTYYIKYSDAYGLTSDAGNYYAFYWK